MSSIVHYKERHCIAIALCGTICKDGSGHWWQSDVPAHTFACGTSPCGISGYSVDARTTVSWTVCEYS